MEGPIALLGAKEIHTELQTERLTGKTTLPGGGRGEGGGLCANNEIRRGLVHWTSALNTKTTSNFT